MNSARNWVVMAFVCGTAAAAEPAEWRGVHVMAPKADGVPLLKRAVAEGLAPLGVNTLLLEVDYNFAFRSHPELGQPGGMTADDARGLAAVCREKKIRLIPLFNCLGHQSWAKETYPLLKLHPDWDESPRAPADNAGLYCRSWCPQAPEVNAVAFELMDELIEAFGADAMHVGLDEVFVLASEQCPRCKGKDRAGLFARAVNDYHRHLVGARKVEMLMWGDRLLDNATMKYGIWESSANGTAPAADLIPKDVVVCDWHYETRAAYPSVPYLLDKGFRVWPATWRDPEAARAFCEYARDKNRDGRMIGHLCTTWSGSDAFCKALLDPELGKGAAPKSTEGNARVLADNVRDAFRRPQPAP